MIFTYIVVRKMVTLCMVEKLEAEIFPSTLCYISLFMELLTLENFDVLPRSKNLILKEATCGSPLFYCCFFPEIGKYALKK